MKKLLLAFSLLASSVAVANAQTVEFDFSNAALNNTDATKITLVGTASGSNVQPLKSFSFEGITCTLADNKASTMPAWYASNKDIRIYAKSAMTVTAPAGKTIESIEFQCTSSWGSKNYNGLEVTSGTIDPAPSTTPPANGLKVTWTKTTDVSDVTLTVPTTKGSYTGAGNPQFRFTKMTVTLKAAGGVAKEPANLKFPQASYTVNLGDEFDAPVVTKDTPAAATYVSSDPAVAAVNATNGAVTVLAAGTTTITATCEETDDYYKGTAYYTLEVVDPNKPGASIDNPYTVAQALEVCKDSPKGVYVKGIVTEVTTEFSSQYNNVTFNIADVAGGTDALEVFRCVWGEGVEATADKNPQVGATVVIFGNLKIYNGKKEFDAKCQIVKYEAPAKSQPEMSFPEETYTVNLGETFTAPTATVTPALAVKYESSLPAVAEVDATTGAVTIKTYGTTEITATTEETSELLPGKATYTLEVINPEITAESPLTVAEALAVIANNPHKVYVKGVVTKVTTEYSAQYKNVTFNIAATADGTEVLEAFRASWADGVTAPADNNPEVGYTVVISGNLEVYNDKKEISSGKIVSYTKESGVEDVIANDSNAPVKYYNLQGVEVANPESGLYIRVQGDKATKVIL